MNKEMLKGTIDLLILSVLVQEDSYGYEISKTIKDKTDSAYVIQETTLYLALKRLEKQEATTTYWGNETQGGRRKYYSITEKGETLLKTYQQDWKEMSSAIEKFI